MVIVVIVDVVVVASIVVVVDKGQTTFLLSRAHKYGVRLVRTRHGWARVPQDGVQGCYSFKCPRLRWHTSCSFIRNTHRSPR